ncbi:hypothetical protein D3C86_223370 [compost metagenome]
MFSIMNRCLLVFSVFMGMFILSCTGNNEKQSIESIQGSWVFDTATLPDIGSGRVISKIRDNCGFEFRMDSCKMSCAFYRESESNVCDGMTTGFRTNFDIKKDSLRIWDVERKSWHIYLIKNLTKDSLILFDQNMNYDVAYCRPSSSENNSFDGIFFSKVFVGVGYTCVDESFYFDRRGNYYYQNSNDELSAYRFNQKIVDRIFQAYDRLDVGSLKSEYIGGGTGPSLHYSISFIRNGTVIKRVIDHQNTGPDELLQAYIVMISNLKKYKAEKVNFDHKLSKLAREESQIFYQKMGFK